MLLLTVLIKGEITMEEKNLCTVTGNLIVPEEVFTTGGAEKLLKPLRERLKEFEPDLSTGKSRKEIATFARKFSASKKLVDDLGKERKAEFQKIIEPIDKERKIFRDECDKMRDEARKPLTDWEKEQERIAEAERQKIAMELDWDEAHAIDDLFNREREMARKEAEFARIEEEKRQKEELERLEAERIAREEQIKKEAEEKAKKEAEEKLAFEQAEKERLIAEAKQREEQAKIDSENAEKKRLADIEAEKQKAEREKHEAIAEQKRIQEEKERIERERIEAEKAEAERRARNRNHQKAVNNKVLKKIMACGISDNNASELIEDILKNPIPEITINY